jgi:hypothetical protein
MLAPRVGATEEQEEVEWTTLGAAATRTSDRTWPSHTVEVAVCLQLGNNRGNESTLGDRRLGGKEEEQGGVAVRRAAAAAGAAGMTSKDEPHARPSKRDACLLAPCSRSH